MHNTEPSLELEKSLTTFSEFIPVAGQAPTRPELSKLVPFSEHNAQLCQPSNSKLSTRYNNTYTPLGKGSSQDGQGWRTRNEFLEGRMEKTTELRKRPQRKLQHAYRMVNQIYKKSGLEELYPEGGPFSTRGEMELTSNDFQATRKTPNSIRREFHNQDHDPSETGIVALPSIHRNLHPDALITEPPPSVQRPKGEWHRARQTIQNLKSLLG